VRIFAAPSGKANTKMSPGFCRWQGGNRFAPNSVPDFLKSFTTTNIGAFCFDAKQSLSGLAVNFKRNSFRYRWSEYQPTPATIEASAACPCRAGSEKNNRPIADSEGDL